MLKLFKDFAENDDVTLESFYKIFSPDPKAAKLRERKVAKAIAYLGEKYLLAKNIEKKRAAKVSR
jgi:hypothetical protein